MLGDIHNICVTDITPGVVVGGTNYHTSLIVLIFDILFKELMSTVRHSLFNYIIVCRFIANVPRQVWFLSRFFFLLVEFLSLPAFNSRDDIV